MILKKLKEWIEYPSLKLKRPNLKFEPLLMTVLGKGGTGKSFLIDLVVSLVKRLCEHSDDFKNISTTLVCAQTGAAAYNSNGLTFHSCFGINPNNPMKLSQDRQQKLIKNFQHIVMLLLDERSMISKEVIGIIDKNTRLCLHGGKNQDKLFGGIPIIVMFGDDHQLPPVATTQHAHGAFHCLEDKQKSTKCDSTRQIIEHNGKTLFLKFANTVRELTKIERIETNENQLGRILNDMRKGGTTKTDAEKLLSLHINNVKNENRIEQIKKDAIYLFATNDKRNYHNAEKLLEIITKDNPCVPFKAKYWSNKTNDYTGVYDHFKGNAVVRQSIIAENAKVAIKGRNFFPNWGLYNGAMGTVKEIVFKDGESPLTDDLPLYVVVDFPLYKGPQWLTNNPTYIPIPAIETICASGCCTCKFIPLEISFATTIHKFQGMEAGPGKTIKIIVVDIGNSLFESNCPGTAYVACSRVSTLENFDINKTPLYFHGEVTYDRLTNLIYKRNSNKEKEEYLTVQRRSKWIEHLRKNLKKNTITNTEKKEIKNWIESTTISAKQLEAIIDFHIK